MNTDKWRNEQLEKLGVKLNPGRHWPMIGPAGVSGPEISKSLEAQEAAISALGYDFVLYTGKPYVRSVALYKSKNHDTIERSKFCESFPDRLAALDWILQEKSE